MQHGADADEIGAALDGFVGGVASIEVGENENRGIAGDGTARRLGGSDFGDGCGIVLERSVEQQVGPARFGDFGGFADFFDIGPTAGFAGTVADEGDARLDPELLGGLGALDGDVGQRFRIGVGVYGAIAIDQHLIGQTHKKDRRDDARLGMGFDELQRGPDGVG